MHRLFSRVSGADRAPRPSSGTSLEEYLALHRVVHGVARALEATVPTERLYILSLGSHQGNAHVHWHVAALPPGVPYHEQQFRALMTETKGVLALSAEEQADLADQLRSALDGALTPVRRPFGPLADRAGGWTRRPYAERG
jgi:hypothetical protein